MKNAAVLANELVGIAMGDGVDAVLIGIMAGDGSGFMVHSCVRGNEPLLDQMALEALKAKDAGWPSEPVQA